MKDRTLVYRFKNGLYINLTNRCPNLCVFCIKTKWHMQFDGHNLDLAGQEPSAQEVLEDLDKQLQQGPVQEVVFCGYGECTMRLEVLLTIGRALKAAQAAGKYPPFKIRLNTNGLGNLIHHRNIAPDLKSAVDSVCVSLNAENENLWRQLMRPAPGFENGFNSVLGFIRACVQEHFDRVCVSCVENTGANAVALRQLAIQCGAQFQEREYLDGNQ